MKRLLLPILSLASTTLAAPELPGTAREFLENYCTDCHDRGTHKAGLNLADLPLELQSRKTGAVWEGVFDRLDHAQMPPQKSEQPTAPERTGFQAWLGASLQTASRDKQQREGRVPLRRLTRGEYENTLRELLGVETELKELFPEDASTAGFDKVSEGLTLSPVHFARYQQAAQKALEDAIPTRPSKPLKVSLSGADIMKGDAAGYAGMKCWMKGDAFVVPSKLFFPYTAIKIQRAPKTGRYRVRVSAYGIHTQGRPLPMVFGAQRESSLPDAPDVSVWHDVPPDEPATVSSELTLGAQESFFLYGWTLPHRDEVSAKQKKLNLTPEQSEEPALAITRIEAEGPLAADGSLESWPPQSYKTLFGDLPLRPLSETKPGYAPGPDTKPAAKRNDTEWAADPLVPYSSAPKLDAERLIRQFVPKAFRRPVSEDVQRYYVDRALAALDAGIAFHDAMKSTFTAVLCSPYLIFLDEKPGALDDYAIAARLSYFLWNSPPDQTLLDAATRGELRDPAQLHTQVERLLNDAKSVRFEKNFTDQWLDLNRIAATAPDAKLYPEFDRILQESALSETQLFFHEVLTHNRSLLEFVQSDWTYLNERLAYHYNLPAVAGHALRKVTLAADSHRGGVMTQASVLKVTADGAKTSPILRGKWICERILGLHLPTPPEDVAKIEPDIRGATTIRVQLEKHRSTPACASCHTVMDPPGFALETYDVIGGWRQFYRTPENTGQKLQVPHSRFTVNRGLVVEEGYEMPDGRRFAHVDDYKRLLLEDPDAVARNLASRMLTYATGAPVQFADREILATMTKDLKAQGYGFRTLVHMVVSSRPFLHK